MAEVVKKQFKSKYHILIWIAVLALILMGMVEYGYVTSGRSFGNWKVHLGLIPYAAWLVLTYIATKPKWFIKRYNPKEMFEVHRIVGIVSVVLVCAHWYVYFLKALKSFLRFFGAGYYLPWRHVYCSYLWCTIFNTLDWKYGKIRIS